MIGIKDRVARLSPEQRSLLAMKLAQAHSRAESKAGGTSAFEISLENRFDPFPLTELQQAYWIGRSGPFGISRVASHSYLEFEGRGLDVDRLRAAWRRVVERHEMLRAIVLEDGQQRILQEPPPYEMAVVDLRAQSEEDREAVLASMRSELSHQMLPSDRWPLFDIRAARLEEDRTRVFVSVDALIADAWSLSLLMREWGAFYWRRSEGLPRLELSFRDYVLAERSRQQGESYERAKAYWHARIDSLPRAPELPLTQSAAELKEPRFERRIARLEAGLWGRLKAKAAAAQLTEAGVLLAAYVEVLGMWSANSHFTVNVPRFNRQPFHPSVNDLVGEFASFTLLEVNLGASGTFAERARSIRDQLWNDLNHAAFSGVEVLREMARRTGSSEGTLMPVVFTSLAQDTRTPEATGLKSKNDSGGREAEEFPGRLVYSINQTSQVWLDNHVSEKNGELWCEWDTVDAMFPEGMPQEMLNAYMRLLGLLAAEEDIWGKGAAEIANRIFPEEQKRQRAALRENGTPLPEKLAHTFFCEQAGRQPEAVAVINPRRSLTYGELLGLSQRIGRCLLEGGAGPNRLVGIVMEKGWEQVAAVLGIAACGAAYLPIDSEVPRERLWDLLKQGGVQVVLTQSWVENRLEWPEEIERICVDQEDWERWEAGRMESGAEPDDLLYVLFTSGSTGTPKGVMVAHRGVVNAIVETNREFTVGAEDRVLALTALHHDMSVYDIFGVLAAGGTIVMPEAEGRRDPAKWSELIQGHGVTIWNSVPAMMEMMLEYGEKRSGILGKVRLAFLGGDWISVTLPGRLGQQAARVRLVSVGGPTETTLWNIWYPVDSVRDDWRSVPYGRPIANTRYYVLNEIGVECPTWVTGEMCCTGVGVAKGYWGDEEKTAAKFGRHPLTGERMYRTGDLGRFLPDGNLEFVGRKDLQVKIQGQRIELGEIEAALQQHPEIRMAAVAAVGERHKRLVAYVVSNDRTRRFNGELGEFLQEKLPRHMVPQVYVQLDQLPLTVNGKVDRVALRSIQEPAEQPAGISGVATGGGLTERIARLVGRVLELETVESQVNFLTYGANSIDMVRIGNQLEKEFGLRPRMDQLFRLQTVAALAGFYAEQLGQGTPERPGAELDGDTKAVIGSYRVLLDPAEREAFKKSQPGLRRDLESREWVQLIKPEQTEALKQKYRDRRTHRNFSLKPISLAQFSQFASCLEEMTVDGKPKYLYASPGGLYPTQVYFHVKPGRIEGVRPGVYYYHPVEHRLRLLAGDVEIDRSVHIPFINTPIFDEAAFSIFLVGQLGAIAPGYGERSVHFATLEAGLIAQLLESSARETGLGLCQIGNLDFDRIRSWFDLDKSHLLIHSLVGGLALADGYQEPEKTGTAGDMEKAAKILGRIRQLTGEEVKGLLAAHKLVGKRTP